MTSALTRKIPPRKPLGDEVYQALKTAILQRELVPGQRLIEAQLAERLGASRTPVRQAMHMLLRENLIERRGRGFAVRGLSRQDIVEILDLRCVLESFAARRATENITPGSLALLERQNEAFGQAIENGRTEKLAALNTVFHETLYSLARSRRLKTLIRDLHEHLYRYRVVLLQLKDMARTSYQDHLDMIEAMKKGTPDLAEQLVRRHILKGKEAILKEMRRGGDNPF
ncbi:MAG: GntR family transcriptional regulator [Thermodesulfobacteriota bacterium]